MCGGAGTSIGTVGKTEVISKEWESYKEVSWGMDVELPLSLTDGGNAIGIFEVWDGIGITSKVWDGIWTSEILIGVTNESKLLSVGEWEPTLEVTKGSLKSVLPWR